MSDRTLVQVEAEIEALLKEKWALEHPIIEYPKHIVVDGVTVEVTDAEHEKAVKASKQVVETTKAASGDTHTLVEAPKADTPEVDDIVEAWEPPPPPPKPLELQPKKPMAPKKHK